MRWFPMVALVIMCLQNVLLDESGEFKDTTRNPNGDFEGMTKAMDQQESTDVVRRRVLPRYYEMGRNWRARKIDKSKPLRGVMKFATKSTEPIPSTEPTTRYTFGKRTLVNRELSDYDVLKAINPTWDPKIHGPARLTEMWFKNPNREPDPNHPWREPWSSRHRVRANRTQWDKNVFNEKKNLNIDGNSVRLDSDDVSNIEAHGDDSD